MFNRIIPVNCGLVRSLSICLRNSSSSSVMVELEKEKKLSRAMKFYMEKRRNYEEFIDQERAEFDLGKKHLANMMGMDAESMTQEDIDKAIDYLFPSGLYEPRARPIMKPPEEVFPLQKASEFDMSGRPYHPFFYTKKPQYTQTLYELAEHINNVNLFSEKMRNLKVPEDPNQVLDANFLSATRWLNLKELKQKFNEDIKQENVDDLIRAMERLVELPFSYKAKDFIFKFRVQLSDVADGMDAIIQPEYDVEGRSFVEFTGLRKSSVAKVKVIKPGSGRFTIRHVDHMELENDITYFFSFLDRMQCMYPLQFTKQLGLVDVECIVDDGGPTGQSGAIRYALSMCLRSFVDEETIEEMKVCGLLTQDVRVKERKKYGREGARRRFTWKKR